MNMTSSSSRWDAKPRILQCKIEISVKTAGDIESESHDSSPGALEIEEEGYLKRGETVETTDET